MDPLTELESIDRNLTALVKVKHTLEPGTQRLVLIMRIDRLLDQRHTLTSTNADRGGRVETSPRR